jgi:SCY1-like protein 1
VQPDTLLAPDADSSRAASPSLGYGPVTTTSATNGTGQAGLVTSATGAAGALAGWAIASLGRQLATPDVHSTMTVPSALAVPDATSPVTSPNLSGDSGRPMSSLATPAGISRGASAGPAAGVRSFGAGGSGSGGSSGSGMKLGGAKKSAGPSSLVAEVIADEWADGDGDAVENAWGTDDLIDVNADADDWGERDFDPHPGLRLLVRLLM